MHPSQVAFSSRKATLYEFQIGHCCAGSAPAESEVIFAVVGRTALPLGVVGLERRQTRKDIPAKLTTLCSSIFHCWYRCRVPCALGTAFRKV